MPSSAICVSQATICVSWTNAQLRSRLLSSSGHAVRQRSVPTGSPKRFERTTSFAGSHSAGARQAYSRSISHGSPYSSTRMFAGWRSPWHSTRSSRLKSSRKAASAWRMCSLSSANRRDPSTSCHEGSGQLGGHDRARRPSGRARASFAASVEAAGQSVVARGRPSIQRKVSANCSSVRGIGVASSAGVRTPAAVAA